MVSSALDVATRTTPSADRFRGSTAWVLAKAIGRRSSSSVSISSAVTSRRTGRPSCAPMRVQHLLLVEEAELDDVVDQAAAGCLLAAHRLLELLEREPRGAEQDLAQAQMLELLRRGAHSTGSST